MRIISILVMGYLSKPIDLFSISNLLDDPESLNKKTPWKKLKPLKENYYIAINKSGKVLISGLKKTSDITKISEIIEENLSSLYKGVIFQDIKILNIIMIESLPTTYSLENITRNLEYKKTSYEPEQFPGLIYKDWGVTFLLFSTGKIIITGIKNENIAPTLLERFLKLIQK